MTTAGLLQRYAKNLAETGGVPNHWLDVPGRRLEKAEAEDLLDQWVTSRARHAGGPGVLSGGVTLNQAQSMSAKDLTLLELSQFSEARIAVLTGVPPFLVALPMADSLTYSNTEQLFEQHNRAGLRPKVNAIMQALSGWLEPRGTSVELNGDEYSQPDMYQRAQTYQILSAIVDKDGNPAITVEEIRARERFAGIPAAASAVTGAELSGTSESVTATSEPARTLEEEGQLL
jgi:phage portal protein BeeE